MKRIFCTIISLILVLSTYSFAFAAIPSDVEGKTYAKAVEALMETGSITGDTDGMFHPDETLTRAQVCSIVVKTADTVTDGGISGFADMSGYGWAEPFVKYAVEYGITAGYPDGTFKPGKAVTSNELVTFVLRAAGYSDSELGGRWPDNYIEKGRQLGLYEDLPEEMPENALKWMAAQMIYNAMEIIEQAELEKVISVYDYSDIEEDQALDIVVLGSMDFVGPATTLSLQQSIERMQTTGPGFEAAVLARDTLTAVARANTEAWKDLKLASATNTMDGKIVEISRRYFANQASIQYEIALNNLEATAVRSYFGVLQAQENSRISEENLEIKTKLLSDVKLKYSLGVAARVDVSTAENDVLAARVSAEQAETMYKKAKMGFNMQLNYPLMQEVELSEDLEQQAMPNIILPDAIKAALAARNEIKTAKYDLDVAQIEFNHVLAYPRNSAAYLSAKADLQSKKMANETQLTSIEMEIRNKYMDLMDLASEVNSARSTVANASEGLRLARLSYNAGMNTLTDVRTAQNGYLMAQLGLSKSITDFNLAIYDFEFATGFGTGSTGQ